MKPVQAFLHSVFYCRREERPTKKPQASFSSFRHYLFGFEAGGLQYTLAHTATCPKSRMWGSALSLQLTNPTRLSCNSSKFF